MGFGGTSCPRISHPLVAAVAVDLQCSFLAGKNCHLGLDTSDFTAAIAQPGVPKGMEVTGQMPNDISFPPRVQRSDMLQGEIHERLGTYPGIR